jgi:predicted PurR-regulated permease PerM
MVVLVLGAHLAGIWGMVLAAPLTALIVEIYKYIQTNME